MKISEIFEKKSNTLSFELFPPKSDDKFDTVAYAAGSIAAGKPDYMSVTYGAGGTSDRYTFTIAKKIQDDGIPALAHLTCVGASPDEIIKRLDNLKALGIENVLALRGDIPEGMDQSKSAMPYASQLVSCIKSYGNFCIGAACYPGGHPESKDLNTDLQHLKEKVDQGVDFITTQMFFKNDEFYAFAQRLAKIGIDTPVVTGLMPVTNASQIKRMIALSGQTLPDDLMALVKKYADDPVSMKAAGLDYVSKQAIDLIENGFGHIHIYSMNKTDVAATMKRNLASYME